jgi:cytochrome c biogenesis protein
MDDNRTIARLTWWCRKMSTAEETIKTRPAVKKPSVPILNRLLDFISSVRFGVVMLCVLVVLSMIGMLIIQQNVDGFEAYYTSLTPAERLVYGSLGFFDIYHSWYFNVLLLILSLNIVLASIDRFPSAWSYVVKPKLDATKKWLQNQKTTATITITADDRDDLAKRIAETFRKYGLKTRITEKRGDLFVFGQSGKYNRIGAYIVHVSLLTLFLGHFVANITGFDAVIRMIPGQDSDRIQMEQFEDFQRVAYEVQVPFSMTCTDIQQRLIDPHGSIDVTNTLDWRTQMRIDDPEYGTTIADISMNKPFSYRGFRFFQSQTIPVGNARSIDLELTSQSDGTVQKLTMPRLGSATLPDGTFIEYEEFLPDFTFGPEGKPDTRSGDYNNPVAVLGVTQQNSERVRVFAFAGNVAENIPVGAPKAGYKWRLTDYEKSPFAHVLSIKYDPYSGAFIAWYFGGFGLMFALSFVFFFSHRRIWALLEKKDNGEFEITLGGHSNRNHAAFEEKFARVENELRRGRGTETSEAS